MIIKIDVSNTKWARKQMSFLFVFTCFMVVVFIAEVKAQELENRPKIGLVLSGGGAKGLAHIGVLKVLEENNIPIDYIGGTSMGAIIGGLYASGYSANQLDSIFRSLDYDAIVRDFVARDSKNFYEKSNDERYAITLPFKNYRLGIPASFSKGLYNFSTLSQLTHHVRGITNFSQLPIPFVCIATDIEKGEQVTLTSGSLALAMFASGSLPSLYAPVEINGRLLIDGGVVNNYPIEEVKAMGADIIIGIDVQDDLRDRSELQDASRILAQIASLQMMHRMRENREQTHIYIRPDIQSFSVMSFDRGVNIIKVGEDAANAEIDKISRLPKLSRPKSSIKPTKDSDSLYISSIKTPILKNYNRAYVKGKLRLNEFETTSFGAIKKGFENINATQNFNAIAYTLKPTDDGDQLHVFLKENPSRSFLKLGVHYDGLYKSALLVNFTRKRTLFQNDVASFDLILGDNIRYTFDYYIDNGFYWSFGLKSQMNQFDRNVGIDFNNGALLSLFGISSFNINYIDFSNQAYMQTLFYKKFLLGGGFEHRKLRIQSETFGSTTPLFDDSHYLSLYAYSKFDDLDHKFFPKSGILANAELKTFVYSSDYASNFKEYTILKGDISVVKTFFHSFTFKLITEAGTTIGPRSVPFFDFVLGGYGFYQFSNFKPFYGYNFLSLSGNSFIKTDLTVSYEIYKRNYFSFSANYANIGNDIFRSTDWIGKAGYSGYAFGYAIDSVIGPIEIKHAWSPETKLHYIWFNIGYSF